MSTHFHFEWIKATTTEKNCLKTREEIYERSGINDIFGVVDLIQFYK